MCTWTKADGSFGPTLLIDSKLTLPFIPSHWFSPDLGWLYVVFGWMVVVGTSNAVNLTDGLDGLAIVPTIVSATTFAILCYVAGTTLHIADSVTVNGRRASWPRRCTSTWASSRCRAARSWPSSAPPSSARASPSSGSTPTRRPSSWATWARWRWAARWAALAVLSKNEVVSAIIHGVFFAEIL